MWLDEIRERLDTWILENNRGQGQLADHLATDNIGMDYEYVLLMR